MRRNDLEKAFAPIPEDCYQAMMTTAYGVKEEPIVKKKISFVMVVVLVLILAAGVALALASWQDTAKQIVVTEQESGYYENWPVEKKAALVKALVEQGYTEKTEAVEKLLSNKLSDTEAGAAADEALKAFTGREVSEISFMEIMQATWGPFEQWTKEEQAWYSQLMVDMGLQGEDHTLYVLPSGPVDEAKAIAIARREIAQGYGVSESVLDAYTVTTSFQVPEFVLDNQSWWYVELNAKDDIPETERLFNTFWVFVHPETGELYESVESLLESKTAYEEQADKRRNDPLTKKLVEFCDAHGTYLQGISLDAKALWSKTIAEEVLKRYAQEPDFFSVKDAAFSSFTYGLPDEKSLSQADALELAKKALVDPLGRKEEELRFFLHKPDVYYDITNTDKPLWKFFFHMPSQYDSDEAFGAEVLAYYGENVRVPNYKVELDARTGEITAAYAVDLKDVDTLEEWKGTM
jgi:hypothetical protein